MKPLDANEEGFTIVETVVSMVILSAVILVTFSMLASTIILIENTETKITAAGLAQEYMENWQKIKIESDTDFPSATRTIDETIYTISASWTKPVDPSLKMVEMIVDVSWTDRSSNTQKYSLVVEREL